MSPKWQVSNGGVRLQDANGVIDWSADGKGLLYVQSDKVFEVSVRAGTETVEISAPKEVMNLPAGAIVLVLLPDGKRTLVARSASDQTSPALDLILNWQRQLQ